MEATSPPLRYTRSVAPGELFVAVRGERHDGHAFLPVARDRGAAGALVDERYDGPAALPLIVADDSRRGLGRLARHWRGRSRARCPRGGWRSRARPWWGGRS